MLRRNPAKEINKQTSNVPVWRRAFAYVIDLIILSFVIFLPMGEFFDTGNEDMLNYVGVQDEFSFSNFAFGFLTALLCIFYWGVLEYKLQQSIGKMAMGIKVKDALNRELKLGQCLLRNVTKTSLLFLFFDLLYGIFKKDNVRFFEVISNTRVINANGGF